jgi:hypothetical protein
MGRDRFDILLAVRRLTVEQARQALAVCLKAEATAAEAIDALDATARRDRAAASAMAEAPAFLEMFAARSDTARTGRAMAVAALAAAKARSAAARGAVTAARSSAEAVETLIAERMAAEAAEANRRAQHVLDDIARVPRV